ncbi:TetR/AcrR family transcriptional regulator [Rhodococcus sp. X156]|uniref:TetR/AcrR family transcriptional regulator n=1 Tax=Rhodococcus sp. X156 TaxID=2499145 RepID=UPI0013E3ABB4|nr:TetR/AcrR family transcriptional regulator [Rhodococcus sp. X156]
MAGSTRRVRTPSGDVRAALVDAAEAVLVREGPSGVTVRAVATEAGVAPMGVYNRFGDKEGLERELLVRGFHGLRDAVAPRGEADPLQRLRCCGVRYREFALSHPQHYRVMFDATTGAGFASEQVQEAAMAAFGELVGHVQHAMAQRAIATGDAEDLASQIWAAVHGAVSLELAGCTVAVDPEATYGRLLDLVITGLTAS